jgi:hypothetical protein
VRRHWSPSLLLLPPTVGTFINFSKLLNMIIFHDGTGVGKKFPGLAARRSPRPARELPPTAGPFHEESHGSTMVCGLRSSLSIGRFGRWCRNLHQDW